MKKPYKPQNRSSFQIFQVFQRKPPSQIEGPKNKMQLVQKELGCAELWWASWDLRMTLASLRNKWRANEQAEGWTPRKNPEYLRPSKIQHPYPDPL